MEDILAIYFTGLARKKSEKSEHRRGCQLSLQGSFVIFTTMGNDTF